MTITGEHFGAVVTNTSEVAGSHRVRFFMVTPRGPAYSESVKPARTYDNEDDALRVARKWARVARGERNDSTVE